VGQRSKITALPKAVREWLDTTLAEKNFGRYQQLETELAERGYSIGKSSIHRYGAHLEKRLGAIKASTEAAKLIAAQAPDDADQRSAAVISLVQTEIFDTLVKLQEADEAEDPVQRVKLLSAAAKNIATLSRASVNQKRHEIEIRGKVEAAAKAVAKIGKRGGVSAEAIRQIEAEVLRIAT